MQAGKRVRCIDPMYHNPYSGPCSCSRQADKAAQEKPSVDNKTITGIGGSALHVAAQHKANQRAQGSEVRQSPVSSVQAAGEAAWLAFAVVADAWALERLLLELLTRAEALQRLPQPAEQRLELAGYT
eukprot:GHUV01037865.1.p1 GENE.GHUV01037865.1~~GHUV01037865.1.p1  ORF type:complete len:128 (+),score=32.04 GHUV01037865.1:346-729(+)